MILDTSILIEVDRGADPQKVEKLDEKAPHKISSITVSEFFAGVHLRDSTEKQKAEKIISQAEEIPMKEDIARKSGELIARKKKESLGINLNDIYIAATAIKYGEPVLTKDRSDFGELEELEVKNWEEL